MYELHEKEFEIQGIEMRKNDLDNILNIGVSYILEAVIVKELLFLIIEE